MGLIRIGSAAFDPETIARIEDIANVPVLAGEVQDRVVVTFRDGRDAKFYKQDAAAFRQFIKGLPDGVPLAASFGFSPPPPSTPGPPAP